MLTKNCTHATDDGCVWCDLERVKAERDMWRQSDERRNLVHCDERAAHEKTRREISVLTGGFGSHSDCDAIGFPCACGATHIPPVLATERAAHEKTREELDELQGLLDGAARRYDRSITEERQRAVKAEKERDAERARVARLREALEVIAKALSGKHFCSVAECDCLQVNQSIARAALSEVAVPKAPLSSLLGKWPGDETDEQVRAALADTDAGKALDNSPPTHRCKVCGAGWRLNPPAFPKHCGPQGCKWCRKGSWSCVVPGDGRTWLNPCGPCCDMAPMADQIEPLDTDAVPLSTSACAQEGAHVHPDGRCPRGES
jgi:hypothetical protein